MSERRGLEVRWDMAGRKELSVVQGENGKKARAKMEEGVQIKDERRRVVG